ncbi:MAG: HU family DNA-binding protein [Chloroflexota bacterium]
MSVKYKVVARGNPQNPEAPKKYYANYISSGRVTLRDIANQIAQISTVSSIDMLAGLEALLQVIPQQLANGNIVELGDFGTFQLRLKSDGSETPDAVTAHNITKVASQFRPGKEFKKVLKNTEFEKASS